MPFIGKQPQTGAYSKLDAITTSATATYNLTLDGSAYYPQSANHLLVSLNGVMQAPQDSFTISGSQITFDSALTSSDNIDFIMALGDTLDIGVPSDGSVVTGKLANSAVTAAKIGSGAIEGAAVTQLGGRRNLIINGDMQVAQRSTSESGVVSSGYKTLDRYQIDYSGAGTWTISQDSDAPAGFGSSMKFLCTTSDSLDQGADRIAFRQHIEGQNLQQLKKGTASAQTATASFWVKSNKTGTYVVEIYDHDNSRHINKAYTVNSADTWEYKTVTFEADTTGALDNDNALSLHLHFWLAAGSTYSGGTLQTSWAGNDTADRAAGNVNLADTVNNYFNITGIQLEVGSVATPFEHRSYGEELTLCQRYYTQRDGSKQGSYSPCMVAYSTTAAQGTLTLPTTMRTNPSVSFTQSLKIEDGAAGYTSTQTSLNGSATSVDSINFWIGGFTGLTDGYPYYAYGSGAGAVLKIEAEL
jgi:hypothetical protein